MSEINFITCNNQDELNQVLDYAKIVGKKGLQSLRFCKNEFPFYICSDEDYLGWTDSGNRAANYVSFAEWTKLRTIL